MSLILLRLIICFVSILIVKLVFAAPHLSPSSTSPIELSTTIQKVGSYSKSFKTEKELIESTFWKELVKKKDPSVAESTVIYLVDSNTVYHFAASETDPNGVYGLPGWMSSKRNIELLQVEYGKGFRASVEDIPVSPCMSSVISSGGGSFSQSYTWGQTLSLKLSPSISLNSALLGLTLNTQMDTLDVSYSSTGGILCNAPPGGKVQVFSTVSYMYFPEARKRDVLFRGKLDKFEPSSNWTRIANEESKYSKFGAVFFDMSYIPQHECVTKSQFLLCGENERTLDMNNRSLNLMKGLELATIQ